MKKTISIVVILAFVATMVITPSGGYAQSVMGLPKPGSMVDLSPSYVPVMITGLAVHADNPLLMDFIVNTGNSGMTASQVQKESDRLIKYFLACLTIPENDQWVNLSPYEKQRIVPDDLGATMLGRDMMAQDYLLKQLTASLIYPEKHLGKVFWDTVYSKAAEMYGTTQIPVNTFNKVWILPDTAKVYEHQDTVLVVKSHLKVMLDEDYLSLQKHLNAPSLIREEQKGDAQGVNSLGNQIVRKIILPAIEQEVNTGANFARLRQIYNSMILAVWFKKNLKEALLNQVYTDKSKLNGVNVNDPTIKDRIYRQYVQAYRKGVFNYIKEEADSNTQEVVPRKYFSGGLTPVHPAMIQSVSRDEAMAAVAKQLGVNFIVYGDAERIDANGTVSEGVVAAPAAGSAPIVTGGGIGLQDQDNPFQPKKDLAQLSIRPDSLANFIHVSSDERKESLGGVTRTVQFDNLFTLVSTYSKHDGTTTHQFFGYGITPIIMREAQAGDETGKDWKDILVQLEDGIGPNGIPYRDGVMLGNAYNERLSQDDVEKQILAYEHQGNQPQEREFTELSTVKSYFFNIHKGPVTVDRVEVIESGGKVTFGAAVVSENGGKRIIFESGFLDMIAKKGNPFHMLERTFVYILNGGTHEENRVQEYEYAKSLDRNVNKKIRVNVEAVFHKLVNLNLTQSPNRNEQLAKEWTRKVHESLWEIGVHLMNGEMKKERVRWSENEAAFTGDETDTGDVKVGVFAAALNPLHFGQFEPVLRAIAQLKLSEVGILNQGFEYRKQGTGLNPTFDEREEMAQDFINQFGGLLTLSKVMNGSQADGETKYEKLITLNGNRKGKTVFVYTAVGGDHLHLYAPSKDVDERGYRKPKMDGDKPQPDTATKLLVNMRARLADYLSKNNIEAVMAPNFRELFESLPMPIEVEQMKKYISNGDIEPLGHINLFGTSSTNIRAHFSGDESKDVTFLPNPVLNYINTHGRYRGWIIGLPYAIRRIADALAQGQTPNPKDVALFDNWAVDEIAQGNTPTATSIASDFSFTEQQIRGTFHFTEGSLEAAEAATGVSFRKDMISISPEEAQKVLDLVDKAMVAAVNARQREVQLFFAHVAMGDIRPQSKISFTLNPAAAQVSGTREIKDAQIVGFSPVDGTLRIKRALPKNMPLRKITEIQKAGYESFKASDLASVPVTDAAMAGILRNAISVNRAGAFDKGGIDINSKFLNLQSEGQKVKVTFNPAMIAQFKRGDFSGVSIRILKVAPIDLAPVLGLSA